jgi:UDP-N-acetylmuramoyl-tripeptide--D-alanyl-D-alanine ligase
MKELIKKMIIWELSLVARAYLRRYKPKIIAVTGNVGKTSTKDAIAAVLHSYKKVRATRGNLNNEFGLPLTIIGGEADEYYKSGSSPWFWLKTLVDGVLGLFDTKDYPQYLILEYGADRPGDIKKLARLYPPYIGVVTAVGEIPVHVEYFQDPDDLAKEKSKLISSLPKDGYAVLNHDDPLVLGMKDKTRANVRTFGFNDMAGVRVGDTEIKYNANGKIQGTHFKLHEGQNAYVPITIQGSLGKSQPYAASAAAAVGRILGLNLMDIADALSTSYMGPPGRLRVLKGIKNSIILDDTYNASPSSTHLALHTLNDIKAKRKIAILGDMLELGKYSIGAHHQAGLAASGVADICVFVGSRMKIAAEAAETKISTDRIFAFDTSDNARKYIEQMVQEGDLILVKGSQGMRMEFIVEEIMGEPEWKSSLLVRQSAGWVKSTKTPSAQAV